MLPELESAELTVIAVMVCVAVIGKVAGNETRLWLMVLTSVTLSPSWEVALVAGVIGLALKGFDLIKAMQA